MSQPVEPEITKTPLREIYGWRFWVNYLVCLVVTIWLPLLSLQTEVDGKLSGAPRYVPMYEVYWNILRKPGESVYWPYAAAHLGITFAVMAVVWWLLLRRAPAKKAAE